MATNNITPEDAMLSMEDTDEKAVARARIGEDVRKGLTLDPSKMNFTSYGVISVQWRDRVGQKQSLNIPIKSLSSYRAQQIIERHRVDNSDVPRTEDENGNTVLDTGSLEFEDFAQDLLREHVDAQYEKLLWAFDGDDITSVNGKRIVWSVEDEEIREVDAAIESLRALNIPPNQLSRITEAIDELSVESEKTEEEDDADWEKKSAPRSASQNNSTRSGQPPRNRRRGQRKTQ